MNVLVVGRGGREHSIVMKLSESVRIDKLFVAPGNAGMEGLATCIPVEETNSAKLIDFAKENQIELTIVGPENPLMNGIANDFRMEGLKIFAPTKEAALIEGSKTYAKELMKKYQIPTASYGTFSDPAQAKQYITEKGAPIVIKVDGLAAGKGVVVAETKEKALEAIDDILVSKSFSEAGDKIVIEEFLVGKEFSLMAFVNGQHVFPMIPARDHKRAFDDDAGPNTGGMGAYAPVPDVREDTIDFATREILQKAANGMVLEGRSFTGILYAGLIMTDTGLKVIEFNARFGDPETQVVLPLLKNDLLQVMLDVLNGEDPQLDWDKESCLGVVLASIGYPNAYEKGVALPKIDDDSFIVYAGVEKSNNGYISKGGRVLLVGAKGETLEAASKLAYDSLPPNDRLDGFFYRTDIGKNKEGALG